MLCTFYFDVVTAVCQLLINGYVILCYVYQIAQVTRRRRLEQIICLTSIHTDRQTYRQHDQLIQTVQPDNLKWNQGCEERH